MSSDGNVSKVQTVVADPSALGLFGLALVTLVASSQKLGLTTGTNLVIPWAIFLGASAQLAAGIYDFKHNNTLGGTTFFGYALFWYGVAMTWMIQLGVFGAVIATNFDIHQLGVAFIGYLIFTLYMTVGFANTNKVLFIILILIDLLFIGLSIQTLGVPNSEFAEFGHKLAAYSEFLISLFSFYGSAANVLNNKYGRVMLPLGGPVMR
jgi:hypothetical protein